MAIDIQPSQCAPSILKSCTDTRLSFQHHIGGTSIHRADKDEKEAKHDYSADHQVAMRYWAFVVVVVGHDFLKWALK